MLQPYLLWIKIGAAVAVIAAACYGTWYATSDHYQAKITALQLAWQKSYSDALAAQVAERQKALSQRTDAEAQHAQDQLTINRLAADASRVRVHFPTCGSSSTAPSGSGQSSDGASGVLHDGVDEIFADFQNRVGQLIQRCDQINADAIRLNVESSH